MDKDLTFEKANEQLEAVIKKMESGELTLEENMKCYKEAFSLLSFCYEQLNEFKGQIVDINNRIDEIKNSGN